jgi:hypothetical protein
VLAERVESESRTAAAGGISHERAVTP